MRSPSVRPLFSLLLTTSLFGCGGPERVPAEGPATVDSESAEGRADASATPSNSIANATGGSPNAADDSATDERASTASSEPECTGPAECSDLEVSCLGRQASTPQGSQEECAVEAFATFESELHGAKPGVRVSDPRITSERSYCGDSSLTTTVCAVSLSPPRPYHIEIPVPEDAIGKSLKLYYYVEGEPGPWNVLLFGIYTSDTTDAVGWSVISPGDIAPNSWRELSVDSIPEHKKEPNKFTKLDRIAFAGVHTDASQPDPWAARIFVDHVSIE